MFKGFFSFSMVNQPLHKATLGLAFIFFILSSAQVYVRMINKSALGIISQSFSKCDYTQFGFQLAANPSLKIAGLITALILHTTGSALHATAL